MAKVTKATTAMKAADASKASKTVSAKTADAKTVKVAKRAKVSKTVKASKAKSQQKVSKKKGEGRPNPISFIRNRIKRKALTSQEKRSLGIVLGVVGTIYIGFALFFHFHFLPNTYINGVKVSLDTASKAEQKMVDHTERYELKVIGVEGTSDEVISGENLNLQFTQFDEVSQTLKKQHAILWPFLMFHKKDREINLNITYDAAALEDAMNKLNILNPEKFKAVQDAYVGPDETGYYKVFPEVLGSEIHLDEAKEAIRTAVGKGLSDVDLERFRIYPNVYSDDENLNHREEQWNEYMKSEGMTYVLWNKYEMIFTPEVIGSLLIDNGTDISLNEQAVEDLVMSWHLNYDTYDVPWEFTTHYGDTVTISTGDYGWRMYIDDTTASVKSNLYAHTAGRYEVEYYEQGVYDYNQGLGDTYVEVSIAHQMMWVYHNGECIVETPVVTGTANEERMTDPGCWSVKYKDTSVTLGTYEVNGYESFVNYWICFNGGEGIHDATWRSAFGGDIWLTSGSHGCVNTPIEVMPVVYDNVFEGHAVVLYM